jgi:hypothetical protein
MARYENKHFNREGKVFSSAQHTFDLEHVRLLHAGVDTVKQLYNCYLKVDVLNHFKQVLEGTSRFVEYGGVEWSLAKSGKAGGYQYILKNLDLGMIILMKSFYVDDISFGGHLKIECSPWLIHENTPAQLQKKMDDIANIFTAQAVPSACAVHIAVDVKDWRPPQDFEQRLVTRAKRIVKHTTISDAKFDLSEVAVVYGNGQSYTFGSAGSLQFCVYDKPAEAMKGDKLNFWESIWRQTPSAEKPLEESEYEHGDRVTRLEARFHHTVIKQFANGTRDTQGQLVGLELNTYEQVCDHLTAFWLYALKSFRLQHSSTYIDPLWQLLIEDITIYAPAPDFMYKRAPKQPGEATQRNVGCLLGNMLRLYVRRRIKPTVIVKFILNMGMEAELCDYFRVKQYGEADMLHAVVSQFVHEKCRDLRINGVAA